MEFTVLSRKSMSRLLVVSVLFLLQACGGGGGGGDASGGVSSSCSVSQVKSWVHDAMATDYLWNTQVQSRLADSTLQTSATTSASYFDSLLWKPALGGRDRYSFILSAADYAQSSNAQNVGFGVNWAWVKESGRYLIRARYVEPGSPAALGGIQRGDELAGVNGAAVANESLTQAQLDGLYPGSVMSNTSFMLRSVAGSSTRNVTLSSVVISESPVLLSKIIPNGNNKSTGYLVFNSFMSQKGQDQLIATFRQFKSAGVQDLVLDLRYNGGGLLDISRVLGGLIAGETVRNKIFYQMIHNSGNSAKNKSTYFNVDVAQDANLGLSRVFILTDHATASASEALINGLKPFMQVIQIGQTTNGKPTGMYATPYCDSVYYAINFEGSNAQGVGGYYDGLSATCPASDDLTHQLGDSQESMLAGALAYRSSGQCLAASYGSAGKALDLSIPLRSDPLKNNLILSR